MNQEIIGKCLVFKCESCGAETTLQLTEEIQKKMRQNKLKCPLCGNYTEN